MSGGLDSTILSYLLRPINTWTVGFEEMNEFSWSDIASNDLKSKHKKVLISGQEFIDIAKSMIKKRKEPLSVPNEVLLYKMTQEVKKRILLFYLVKVQTNYFGVMIVFSSGQILLMVT